MAEHLPLPEDRLITFVEGAQVCRGGAGWGTGSSWMSGWNGSGGAVPPDLPLPAPRPPLPQVLGLVGSARKRVLLLWQAVELSRFLGFPNARTLDIAR